MALLWFLQVMDNIHSLSCLASVISGIIFIVLLLITVISEGAGASSEKIDKLRNLALVVLCVGALIFTLTPDHLTRDYKELRMDEYYQLRKENIELQAQIVHNNLTLGIDD